MHKHKYRGRYLVYRKLSLKNRSFSVFVYKFNSTPFLYCYVLNHTFKVNFEILITENKGLKVSYLELLKIKKKRYSDKLLNDQKDLSNSPLLNLFNS